MCIVVIKPMGSKFPEPDIIKNCADNNSHGFSMAWNITTKKGEKKLMNFQSINEEEFLKAYDNISQNLDPKTTGMILHCRIKTTGSVSKQNCHCWKNEEYAFAHNGILHITSRDDMTDSETFFRDLFTPAYKYGGWVAAERVIKAVIESSKFAFIDKEGDTSHHYGDFSSYKDCLFSNESYKTTYKKYGNYGNKSVVPSWKDYDEDYPNYTSSVWKNHTTEEWLKIFKKDAVVVSAGIDCSDCD